MLVKDSEAIIKHKILGKREEAREKLDEQIKREIKDAPFAAEASDSLRQMGRPMSPEALEKYLRKINPNLSLVIHPYNRTKRVVYWNKPDGKREFVCACENAVMPEWSVMSVRRVKVPTKKDRLDKSNLGNTWMEVEVPYRELTRGWRTVFGILVQKGIISTESVERLIGSGDRASWAVRVGRRKEEIPW
jgi:hypothetical protein